MIDKKFLNLKPFEGMSILQLQEFASKRGFDTVETDIEKLREEVAIKDAQRFANKGLRMAKELSPTDKLFSVVAQLQSEIVQLKQRVTELEKD
tara:strand:+ start:352 stop:630 length:279 start_codon:yes stop_codon:yes gene_type:complete